MADVTERENDMSEFTVQQAFAIDEGLGDRLKVTVTHETATGKFLSVTFSDPDRDQMVSVPADLLDRVLAAVERHKEF